MKVYPIYHSGFMVELENHILLFDYYLKDLPIVESDKPLYVFVSHSHKDHYNPQVFDLTKNFKHRRFIFSNDVKCEDENILYMNPNETQTIDDIKVSTLQSTDLGVAFIIEVEDKRIYHAGDLNLWVWEEDSEEANMMRDAFMNEMNKIKDMNFDLAFLPMESQQSDKFSIEGIEIFNEFTDTSVVFPMHYSFDCELMEKRLLMIKNNQNIVNTNKVKVYEF